jgi:hypothetical protein
MRSTARGRPSRSDREYRDYDSGSGRSNQRSYGASAGLTWSINRYLDLEADASYERTEEPGRTDEETTRIGLVSSCGAD